MWNCFVLRWSQWSSPQNSSLCNHDQLYLWQMVHIFSFKRFDWIEDKHCNGLDGHCGKDLVSLPKSFHKGIWQHTHKPIRWAWRSTGADVRWEGGRVQVKGVLEEDVRSVNWEWPRAPAWNLSHNAPIRSTPFNITLEDHDHRGDRSHGLRWPWSSSLSSKAITVMTMAAVKLVEQVKYLSEMNCELWILFDGLTPGWTLQSASWYWMPIRKICQDDNDYVWQSNHDMMPKWPLNR